MQFISLLSFVCADNNDLEALSLKQKRPCIELGEHHVDTRYM